MSSSSSSSSSCSTCSRDDDDSTSCSSKTESTCSTDSTEESVENNNEPMSLTEQVYQEKLADIQKLQSQLQDGTHVDYVKQLKELENLKKNQLKMNNLQKKYLIASVEKEYDKECHLAKKEFYVRKNELKETLIEELIEKKKAIEEEYKKFMLDFCDQKPSITRKLRRRPNDSIIPSPEEKCSSPFPVLNIRYQLLEHEIEQDVKAIKESLAFVPSTSKTVTTTVKKKDTINSSSIKKSGFLQMPSSSGNINPKKSENSNTERSLPTISCAKIVDGKLLFEKRWFHRGQPIYVEGKSVATFSAVISSISGEKVWVKRSLENVKYCIHLSDLSRGEMSIKRRAEI